MSGGLRLGFGYTFAVIAGILLLTGAVLQGTDIHVSGGGEQCSDGGVFGGGDCQEGGGSVDVEGAGIFLLVPGAVLGLVAAPLVVSGHLARQDEQGTQPPRGDQGQVNASHDP